MDEARNIHALDLADDAELEDSAASRIVMAAREGLLQRELLVRLAPVGLL